tara:strand:+ start:108061 stop:108933 length:873 start_codon:yes stop_codon:yes gene_type:complete
MAGSASNILSESSNYPHKQAIHIYDSGIGQYRIVTEQDFEGGAASTDQTALLQAISGNTDTIEVSIDNLEINTDQVENAINTGNQLIASGNDILRDIHDNTDSLEALTDTGNRHLEVIENLLDSGFQRTGDSFNAEVIVAGAVAQSGVPTQHEDGDVVAPWHDDLGRQVIKGFDVSQDVLKVEEQSPALSQVGEQTLLSAVTADGAGTVLEVDVYNKNTFYVQATNVTSGAHLRIETSPDDSFYIINHDENVLKNDTFAISLSDEKHKYVRSLITGYIDGTYTVKWIGGN